MYKSQIISVNIISVLIIEFVLQLVLELLNFIIFIGDNLNLFI